MALVLLLGYLLFHFRQPVAVLLNLAPVMVSLVWTYGIVGAVYGSVNLLTGFLAAILGGLGIEHGIHLLGRYESLRAKGDSSEQATRETFTHTGGSALISALVAALTFLSLAISEFRAFREFGVIAAVGMLTVIAAYVLVLPALLALAVRLGWKPSARAVAGQRYRLARWLLNPRFRKIVAIAHGRSCCWACSLNASNSRFNYDFAALEDNSLPSFVFDRSTNKVLGYSQTPVVVLTPDARSERAVVAELQTRKRERGAASTLDFVAALDDLVPQQQPEKQQVLTSIGEVLAKVKRDEPGRQDPRPLRRAPEDGGGQAVRPGRPAARRAPPVPGHRRGRRAASCWCSRRSAWPTGPRCGSSPRRCARWIWATASGCRRRARR